MIGTQLGAYRVLHQIGESGTGAVYLGITLDAWSQPFTITCVDQPANQIIGLI